MNCLLHYHHEAHVSHIVTVCHVVIVIFIVHCWNQIGRTNFWRHDMADCWYERCWQSFNVLLTAYWQRCQTESVNVARGQGWKIKTTNREDRGWRVKAGSCLRIVCGWGAPKLEYSELREWRRDICSDESKYNLYIDDGRPRTRLLRNVELLQNGDKRWWLSGGICNIHMFFCMDLQTWNNKKEDNFFLNQTKLFKSAI